MRGNPVSLSAEFSAEILQARGNNMTYSKSWKGKKKKRKKTLQLRIFHTAGLSFRVEREIRVPQQNKS